MKASNSTKKINKDKEDEGNDEDKASEDDKEESKQGIENCKLINASSFSNSTLMKTKIVYVSKYSYTFQILNDFCFPFSNIPLVSSSVFYNNSVVKI